MIMGKYKTYTRDEYLKFCKEHCIKIPLPESKRNPFTLSGYPTMPSAVEVIKDDIDADEWYKNHE